MGYAHSRTNQLIANLKIKPSERPERLRYKQEAIERFASEVSDYLSRHLSPGRRVTLVPMPPSKIRSHPEYDDRVEQVARLIAAACEATEWLPLLRGVANTESYHLSSQQRDPDEIYCTIAVDETQIEKYQKGSVLLILDDILTSGAHFIAAARHIQTVLPEEVIAGIFWAKAQGPTQ